MNEWIIALSISAFFSGLVLVINYVFSVLLGEQPLILFLYEKVTGK